MRCGPFSATDGEGRVLYSSIELAVEEGRLTLLEGPSGGGKSTLLRQVAGLAPAEQAARTLGDREWTVRTLPEWRAAVTLVMQDAPVIPGTVFDNLEFPFRLKAAAGRALDRERMADLLDRVDLAGIALDRPITTLSGGERHRLGLVRVALWDPPVVLADEPLSGLDRGRAKACFDLLAELARRPGHAALCVLHDPEMGAGADRRVRLEPTGLAAA